MRKKWDALKPFELDALFYETKLNPDSPKAVPAAERPAWYKYMEEKKQAREAKLKADVAKEKAREEAKVERQRAKIREQAKANPDAALPALHADHLDPKYGPRNSKEWSAIHEYISGDYLSLNSHLRGQGKLTDSERGDASQLDALIGRAKPTDRKVLVHRGLIRPGHKYQPGEVVDEQAFLSTSARQEAARQFGGTHMFEITVPKGTPMLAIPGGMDEGAGDMGGGPTEEMLLPRGAQIRIDRVQGKKVYATITGFKPNPLEGGAV